MDPLLDRSSLVKYVKDNLQAIVPEHGLKLSPLAVEYLAHMLGGYVRSEALFKKFQYGPLERSNSLEPLTLRMQKSKGEGGAMRRVMVQTVGDECLFLVSFFYDYLLARCGSALLKYHEQLGAGAYKQLGQIPDEGRIFNELATQFWDISDVIRELDQSRTKDDPKILKIHRTALVKGSIYSS